MNTEKKIESRDSGEVKALSSIARALTAPRTLMNDSGASMLYRRDSEMKDTVGSNLERTTLTLRHNSKQAGSPGPHAREAASQETSSVPNLLRSLWGVMA